MQALKDLKDELNKERETIEDLRCQLSATVDNNDVQSTTNKDCGDQNERLDYQFVYVR